LDDRRGEHEHVGAVRCADAPASGPKYPRRGAAVEGKAVLFERPNVSPARLCCVAVIPPTGAKSEPPRPRKTCVGQELLVMIDDLRQPPRQVLAVTMNDVVHEARALPVALYSLRPDDRSRAVTRIEDPMIVWVKRRACFEKGARSREEPAVHVAPLRAK